MTIEKIDLHDALLKSMSVDYAARSITLSVDFYKSKDERDRKPALIIFDEVESLSQVSNFNALHKWRTTGNIVQWVPAKRSGTTYIDVIGGCIAVNAKKVRFKRQK
jgi:hypothetical protein